MAGTRKDLTTDLAPADDPLGAEYERDFYSWLMEQACLLREGSFDALDRDNLGEEIESLGREQFNKLESALRVLTLFAAGDSSVGMMQGGGGMMMAFGLLAGILSARSTGRRYPGDLVDAVDAECVRGRPPAVPKAFHHRIFLRQRLRDEHNRIDDCVSGEIGARIDQA